MIKKSIYKSIKIKIKINLNILTLLETKNKIFFKVSRIKMKINHSKKKIIKINKFLISKKMMKSIIQCNKINKFLKIKD